MTHKKLTLELDLETAAFADGFGDSEVAMILKSAAVRVEAGALNGRVMVLQPGEFFNLKDTNGNTVGVVKVHRSEAERVG